MEFDKQLQNILRVSDSTDMTVMFQPESQYKTLHNLNPMEAYSTSCLHQPHQALVQHRTGPVSVCQNPSLPPTKATSESSPRRKRWNMNTMLGHILLLVIHLVQWQKITQTQGVSAEYMSDEDLE